MKTTITLNYKLYRELKIRASENNESISSIIEDAIKYQLLEDLDDIEEVKRREYEPTYSFDELVEEFKNL